MVDPAGRLPVHLHAAARHHGRECGPPGHPARAGGELHRPAVGGRRVRAGTGRVDAGHGLAGRPARPAPDLCDRAWAVRARLADLRSLDHADDAEPVPGGAGHRRGDDVRYLARPYRAGVPPERARHRLWPLGRHHRVRGGGRAAGGWGAHRGSRLGVDLLRQRADRARNGRYDAGAGAEIGARPERQDRLRRPGHLQRRALLPRACAHPRKRRGLGGRVHRRPIRGHRPPSGRVHRCSRCSST